jgi:hypothetical protein
MVSFTLFPSSRNRRACRVLNSKSCSSIDFLDLHVVLPLARLARLPLLLVLELAVVHDAADRGPGQRRDLHEVQALLFGDLKRLLDRHDADLLAIRGDHAHRADADLPVDTQLVVDGRRLRKRGKQKDGSEQAQIRQRVQRTAAPPGWGRRGCIAHRADPAASRPRGRSR